MSIAFYVEEKPCNRCGHQRSRLHIGSSYNGWTFIFHATSVLTSWEAWKTYLEGKQIIDETGRPYTYNQFVAIVKSKVGERQNIGLQEQGGLYSSFCDDEGHGFRGGEFT